MDLKKYESKRDFTQTPEPSGTRGKKHESQSRFVVQKHDASHLHYDFRLEIDGVLRSWAVPKGIPLEPGVKRLAVKTEDHPSDYINFEGTIPEGHYGAGTVEIWDSGTFKLIDYNMKKLEFYLNGRKLSGIYILINTGDNNWLIFKKND